MAVRESKTVRETASRDLVITRIFNAPRELVWKAWTEPEHLKKWHGPIGYTSPYYEVDFRVGGKYLACMRSSDGQDIWSTGVYREIVPLSKIVCTDCFSDEKGNVVPATYYGMPDDIPLEMMVTVTFEELDGKTRMTLRHAGLPAGMMIDGANEGWNSSFEKLVTVVAELGKGKQA